MKFSKSEAGKLGAIKSKETAQRQKNARVNLYNLHPHLCIFCSVPIKYENRKNKFCNSSCSASFNNLKRSKKIRLGAPTTEKRKTRVPIKWGCLNCKKEHITVSWRTGKYCNTKCQQEQKYKDTINNWKNKNTKPGKAAIRRYLTERYGYKCSCCGITEYNSKSIVLEVEHIDGNSENYSVKNLCFLCPNCHSQTPTYKGKNKGNGRHARRQRYIDGKSY